MNNQSHRHHGHRKRALESLMSAEGSAITDIQLLEFLLFYCIERVDTNPIAHRLLDTFGNIENVLAAEEASIAEIRGMGPVSAGKLKQISAFLNEYHTLSTRSGESDEWSFSALHDMISEAIKLELLPKHPGSRYTLLFLGNTRVRNGSYPIINKLSSALPALLLARAKSSGEQIILCVNLKKNETDVPEELKTFSDDVLRSYGITAIAVLIPDGTLRLRNI